MAEIFGTAVSALSVAGMAIQIGSSALKLKALLDALKDAPADILHLIEEIELFSEILSEIDLQHRVYSTLKAPKPWEKALGPEKEMGFGMGMSMGVGGPEDVGRKALERCQKASDILLEAADGLELEARRGGLGGRVKVLLGTGKVARLRLRVEGAWRLLVLAQQVYCRYVLCHNLFFC